MALSVCLWSVAALLILSVVAVAIGKTRFASTAVYATSFAVTSILFVASAVRLGAPASDRILPFGLPWLGAHFHCDPLAAFFLAVINLGAAIASLFSICLEKRSVWSFAASISRRVLEGFDELNGPP